ncbi:hypothetical protein, partial [Streptomyces sp. NPDC059786]|uniref:hypothetical protein n=1 Tax=Streptomyces sp. NPDC059786 TaxID=3346946 RepID=UPI003648C1A0
AAPAAGTDPALDSGTDPAPAAGTDPAPDSGTDPAPSPGTASVPSPGTDPVPSPGTASVPSHGTDPAPAPDASAPDASVPAAPAPAPAPVPAPIPAPLAEPAPPAPPVKNTVLRRRLAIAAASLLAVGAVVAGVGYTVVTVGDADRDAGAPVWKFPAATKADAGKTAGPEGLAGVLVPYGTDWKPGPDLGEYGSDAQLSGAQATALRKESLSGLPRSQRKQLEKEIDRQKLTGMAMRSYLGADAGSFADDDPYTVSIVLAQMKSKAAVEDAATFQQDFLDALDVFRKGPKIEGHKNAQCFLPPADSDSGLDSMFCSAYQGDVLVTATADGVKPLDTKGVAALLRDQLDRIAEPGEAV